MTLLLHTPDDLPGAGEYQYWFKTTRTKGAPDAAKKLPGLESRLESAFLACRDQWWRIGREMASEPTSKIAQMPTAAAFGSDFGLMLAWARLAAKEAASDHVCLAVCSDPWLFRHLASLPGVKAGKPPVIFWRRLWLGFRGLLARCKVSLAVFLAHWRVRRLKKNHALNDHVLLVYGHPRSDALGHDEYFGDLMKNLPGLKRLLHTDCPPRRALALGADGKSASLHAWGNPFFALGLPLARWRPAKAYLSGPFGWLIRRAALLENGGGGPAMNRWQHHCQARWLDRIRPARVAWPWENHGWERAFCLAARNLGLPTLGYQHTVVGPFQFNYAAAANHDGLASIPDLVVCNGQAYLDEIKAWGVPGERLIIGGALRFKPSGKSLFDPAGPVFVPLSAIPMAARAQVQVARAIAGSGRQVLVKEHPMYPLDFAGSANLARTNIPLPEQGLLSAVLYCTGTSGLEALLAGLPAFRLMLEDRIAIDVLPSNVSAQSVTIDTAAKVMAAPPRPRRLPWDSVLASPDMDLWRRLLTNDMPAQTDKPLPKTKRRSQVN